ncbi:MAG: hypothetical protein Tsb0021_10950 [Chlamydiales bacterium]
MHLPSIPPCVTSAFQQAEGWAIQKFPFLKGTWESVQNVAFNALEKSRPYFSSAYETGRNIFSGLANRASQVDKRVYVGIGLTLAGLTVAAYLINRYRNSSTETA